MPITRFCVCSMSCVAPTNRSRILVLVHTCMLTGVQPSECSSVIVQSKSHADSTEHSRKCSLELGYSGLKPEQLEVITSFVGGREVLVTVVCLDCLGLGKQKPLLQLFTSSL